MKSLKTSLRTPPVHLMLATLLAFASPPASMAQSVPATLITGTVGNSATGDFLQGARVEIPELGRQTHTDITGRFIISPVPAGTYQIIATYTGLDPSTQQVVVKSEPTTIVNFELSTAIYRLAEFRVTGPREGTAAALTTQRNATNVRNVVSSDQFGTLPNMSAGELAALLPGVTGTLDDEGNTTGMVIRGMSTLLNSVTVDGGLSGNSADMRRRNGAMFDQIEVIKGHMPDRSPDGLGGTINLRSRSPLSLREKRRLTYNLSGRWAPSFLDHSPLRNGHRIHPLLNFSYQEVFSAFGGERNLGVALNLFYSENTNTYFKTTRNRQDTLSSPAFVYQYYTLDGYNMRKQASMNLKVEYRPSLHSKYSLNTIYLDAYEPFNRLYETRASSAQTVGTTGNAAILPNYTDNITEVRTGNIDVAETMFSFNNRDRQVYFTAEHNWGPLDVNYNLNYSRSRVVAGSAGGASTNLRLANVGWILDRSQSDLYPRFTQTSGLDMKNPDNYRPNGVMSSRDNRQQGGAKEAMLDIQYRLPSRFEWKLKAGGQWREGQSILLGGTRQWSYLGGATPLPHDPAIITTDYVKTGRAIPQFEAAAFLQYDKPVQPGLWQENLYFYETSKYTGTNTVTDTKQAGYLMTQGKFGLLGFAAGVRREKVETEAFGWVTGRSVSTTAERLADPAGSAQRDFADNRVDLEGAYTKSFPSVHLSYDIAPGFKGKVSWSNSLGRPLAGNWRPSLAFSDANQTITIRNPNLRPQLSENWDAMLEYYFEPVGNVSIGWFHKTVVDFIINNYEIGQVPVGVDNGYNGDFPGYSILTTFNGGTAYVQGWEFSYQQQLTFLPGLLRGLGIMANYTVLQTHGDFGGGTERSTNSVPGFIPKTANLALSWRYNKFNARARISYQSDNLLAFNATSAALNQYRMRRNVVSAGLGYQLKPAINLTCDVQNLLNEPTINYRGFRDRMDITVIQGTMVTVGLEGRF